MHVTIRTGYRSPGSDVVVHRSKSLAPVQVVVLQGIPATAPARTLLDLSATLSTRALEQALASALRARLTTADEVSDLVARNPGRTGTPALRSLLAVDEGPAFTRSQAEELFLEMMRSAGLPAPRTNAWIPSRSRAVRSSATTAGTPDCRRLAITRCGSRGGS